MVLLGVEWGGFCLLIEQPEINKSFSTDPRLKLFGICNETSQVSFNLNSNTKKESITFCIIFVFVQVEYPWRGISLVAPWLNCMRCLCRFLEGDPILKRCLPLSLDCPKNPVAPEGTPDPPLWLERSRPPTPLVRLGTLQSREEHLKGMCRQCPAFGLSYLLLFWVLVQRELYWYSWSTCPRLGAATL